LHWTDHLGSERVVKKSGAATSHRVFKTGELAGLIASQLIPKRQGSVANLACGCRRPEVPAPGMLWETQKSLYTLLETLPRNDWDWSDESVVCDLNLPFEEPNAQ